VLTTFSPVSNAPTQATCVFTTAERFLVACGVPGDISGRFDGAFDALRVAWSDQLANQTWTPAPGNLAGAYRLSVGSRIVRGLPGESGNIILTDTALYTMRYVPNANVVYDFTEIASGCGLIGPNAICEVGGVFYWMDSAGGFWAYDGSYPRPLTSTLGRDVHDNLAWVQQDKIYAFPVTINGQVEIWWLYPDSRDGVECSRYVVYGITESTNFQRPIWWNGTFARTSWVNAGVFQYPLALDTSGTIWFQEKGNSQDGGTRSWSITSGYFQLGSGQMKILGLKPDAASLQGNYSIEIDTRVTNTSGFIDRAFGPYNIMSTSAKVNVRANGELAKIKISGSGAPTQWRMGLVQWDLIPSQRMR
jgi:hypothetical protein